MKCIVSFSILDGFAFDIDGISVIEKFFKIKFIEPQTSEVIDEFIEEVFNSSEKKLSFTLVDLFKSPRENVKTYELLIKGQCQLKSGKIEFIVGFNPENAKEFSIK